jgi:hypothetical protein
VEDAVDVETDTWLDAVVGQTERRAEPAHVDRRVAGVGGIELNGRNHLFETIHVECAGVGHQVAGDNRHRNRYFLDRFFNTTRGDDDGFAQPGRLQREIRGRHLTEVDDDLALGRLEPIERDLDAVPARRQRLRLIGALSVRDELRRGIARGVDDADRGARDSAAR